MPDSVFEFNRLNDFGRTFPRFNLIEAFEISIQQLYASFVGFCTEADAGRNLRQFDLQAFG